MSYLQLVVRVRNDFKRPTFSWTDRRAYTFTHDVSPTRKHPFVLEWIRLIPISKRKYFITSYCRNLDASLEWLFRPRKFTEKEKLYGYQLYFCMRMKYVMWICLIKDVFCNRSLMSPFWQCVLRSNQTWRWKYYTRSITST